MKPHQKLWLLEGWRALRRFSTNASRPLLAAFVLLFVVSAVGAVPQDAKPQAAAQPEASEQHAPAALPRGKKLMLKDGTFQLVREYHVEGDRVRYYSIDQAQWEEMPESLVDWNATNSVEGEEAKRDAEVVAKVHARESGRTAQALDIDASLEVAPGVFLPPGEGLFAFDGKGVVKIAQAPADIKFSKKQMLKQVLIPVPIIPSRHTVSLIGARAKLRLKSGITEFYMRTADGRE